MNEFGFTNPIEKEDRSFCIDYLQQLVRDHKAAMADETNALRFLHLYPAMSNVFPPELNARAAFLELCVFYQPQVLFNGIGCVSLSFLIDEYDKFTEQAYTSEETELLHKLKFHDYSDNMLAEYGKQVNLDFDPQYGLTDTNWSIFADHIQANYSSNAKQSALKQEPSEFTSASEQGSSESTASTGMENESQPPHYPASDTSTNPAYGSQTSPGHKENITSTKSNSDVRQSTAVDPTPELHTNQLEENPPMTVRKRRNPMLNVGILLGVCILVAVAIMLSKAKADGKILSSENMGDYEKPMHTIASNTAIPTPMTTNSIAMPTPTAINSPATPTPTPAPIPTPIPTEIPSIVTLSEYVDSRSTYGKLPFISATASSELQYNDTIYWAINVIDGDITTSWQEGVEGDGIGEYLITYFEREQDIDLIRLRLGRASNYGNNGRPKALRFDFSDNSYAIYEFADINQDVYLKTEKPVHTNYIKLTILDAFKGAEYADTCITEVSAYQQGGGNTEQFEQGNSSYIGYVDISSVTGMYCVQCSSSSTSESADYAENYARAIVEAENKLGNTVNVFITIRNDYYAVCLGPFDSQKEAVYQRDLLATLGYNPITALY